MRRNMTIPDEIVQQIEGLSVDAYVAFADLFQLFQVSKRLLELLEGKLVGQETTEDGQRCFYPEDEDFPLLFVEFRATVLAIEAAGYLHV